MSSLAPETLSTFPYIGPPNTDPRSTMNMLLQIIPDKSPTEAEVLQTRQEAEVLVGVQLCLAQ
jgi:hypothetical protein